MPEFLFALDLPEASGAGPSGRGGSADGNRTLVSEVTAGVLKQAGFAPAAIVEISSAIQGAVAKACAGAPTCHLQFHAHAGELVIAVSGGGAAQRITRPLP